MTNVLVGRAEERGFVVTPTTPIGAVRWREVRRHRAPVRARESAAVNVPVDIVDEWGVQSFPASDPPANW